MSKKISSVGIQELNSREFDDFRGALLEEFHDTLSCFKRKVTQAAYFNPLIPDLANQFIREEKWFFGIKYSDEIKLIDQTTSEENMPKTAGFKPKR